MQENNLVRARKGRLGGGSQLWPGIILWDGEPGMDRFELLRSIEEKHGQLLELWHSKLFKKGMGALVFLPMNYGNAKTFKDVEFQFWTLDELCKYLRKNGKDDEVMFGFFRQIDFRKEFVVVVIVAVDQSSKEELYFHQISGEIGS